MENKSPKFRVDLVDIWKVSRGALLTAFASILTVIGAQYANIDYRFCTETACYSFAFIAVPVIGALLELGRRFLSNYQTQ